MITFEFFALDTTGITEAKNSSMTFFGMKAISSITRTDPENPLLADDEVAKALIVDMLEKVISALLYTMIPGLIHDGRYSYARRIRSMISIAV